MACTPTADPTLLQVAMLDLTLANQQYNQAVAQNDYATARVAADRINRDRCLANIGVFLPGPWYSLPANFNDVAPLQLPAGITPPSSPGLAQQTTVLNTPAQASAARTTAPSPKSEGFQYPADCIDDPSQYCCQFPEDPSCFTTGGGYPVTPVPVVTNVTNVTNVTEIVQGLDAATVGNLVDGALSSLWSIVVGALDAALAAAIAGVQAAVSAIADALKKAFQGLAGLLGKVLDFLKSLWQRILKELVAALKTLEALLGQLYDKVLKPLLQALQKLRQKLLEIYQRFIRPLLIILQDIRRVLAILKLFHIKFATKLDQAIADIQARITQPLFFLLQYSNALANWINLIMTVDYLIQRPTWLASLNAYKGSTIALQVNAMSSPVDAATIAGVQQQNALPSTGQSAEAWQQYVDSGSGPYQDLATTQTAQLGQYLSGGL